MRCVRCVWFAVVLVFLTVGATVAAAENISGTLSVTRVIVEDSQLVGDVTCTMTTTPCIQFGAPNIALRLNGFTITGPANPDDTTTCQPASGPPSRTASVNGTSAANSQPGVQIIGPGMVQKFRRHGILIFGAAGVSTSVTIKHITSHHNCFSGLLTNGMTDSVIEGIVSVRNAANSGAPPCGGNCLVNSNNNHIVNNLFGGNGSVCAAALCAAAPTVASNNDFGVGLIGTSSGNLIEHNSITWKLERHPDSDRCVRQHDPPEHRCGEPAQPGIQNVRSDRLRHQGRSGHERRAQHVREELVHHICRTGTFALPEFSRGRASEDLGTDGDTRRPLASERPNGAGDHRRDRDRRQRSEPRMSNQQRDEQ